MDYYRLVDNAYHSASHLSRSLLELRLFAIFDLPKELLNIITEYAIEANLEIFEKEILVISAAIWKKFDEEEERRSQKLRLLREVLYYNTFTESFGTTRGTRWFFHLTLSTTFCSRANCYRNLQCHCEQMLTHHVLLSLSRHLWEELNKTSLR